MNIDHLRQEHIDAQMIKEGREFCHDNNEFGAIRWHKGGYTLWFNPIGAKRDERWRPNYRPVKTVLNAHLTQTRFDLPKNWFTVKC